MVVPGFSDLDMVNISVEFLIKIQPTPSMCGLSVTNVVLKFRV